MRRLLAVALLLCSCAVGAQTDERQVHTVVIDVPPELEELPDERTPLAATPDERLVLARQLVALGQEGIPDAEPGAACSPAPDIVAAYRERPGDFYGISPQSAYWPEVERAWQASHASRCAESPAAILARSYAEHLSVAELRAVIAFQDSPSGRAFIAATRRARADLEDKTARPAHGPDAAENAFRMEMLKLKAKYESDPK
jgi:hypothetical protein